MADTEYVYLKHPCTEEVVEIDSKATGTIELYKRHCWVPVKMYEFKADATPVGTGNVHHVE